MADQKSARETLGGGRGRARNESVESVTHQDNRSASPSQEQNPQQSSDGAQALASGPPLLAAALNYAAHGWPVMPCNPHSKTPLGELVKRGLHDATKTESTIRYWWSCCPTANIGVVTGPESGLLVLDLDRHSDVDGVALAESLYGFEVQGPAQRTGGGGLQAFYRHPAGADLRCVTALDGHPGIDVKGAGGYVVVPPSIHPNGVAYAWLESPDGELPEPPTWLLETLQRAPRAPAPHTPSGQNLGESALILEGARNDALTALGGLMRRRGMAPEALEAGLLAENAAHCLPPLPEAEVRGIARSVGRYDPVQEFHGGDLAALVGDQTDAGNAAILAYLFGDKVRWDWRHGRWLVWEGHWWQEDPDGELPRMALEAAGWRARNAYDTLSDKPEAAKAAFAFALRSRDSFRINACLDLARSTRPIADAGQGWDENPWLLACANGILDLRSGELRDGRREDKITMHLEHAFAPHAECPRWERFIGEIFGGDTGLGEFIQRATGYSLSGVTTEQAFFILHGRGSNGKSVFLEVLRHVLGPFSYDPGFAAFEATPGAAPHPEALAELARRRFVTASETTERTRLNEQRLKVLSHGDTTSAAFKYGKRFEFKPECKIWLALNHRPAVSDDSLGFWRSVRLIPFERQFIGAADDKTLTATLREEAAGILAWAVRGCLAWQECGLDAPAKVSAATEQYRADSDPLGEFLAERCEIGMGYVTRAGVLYQGYAAWAEGQGFSKREILSTTAFGRRLTGRFEKVKAPYGIVYTGLKLRAATSTGHENDAGTEPPF